MIELIIEYIVYLFVEIIFLRIILGFLKLIKLLGIIVLKLFTFSNKSIADLKVKYKDSSKPYFIGFGILGLLYLFAQNYIAT